MMRSGLMVVALVAHVASGMALMHLTPDPMPSSGKNETPSGKRIALILRGETFREEYQLQGVKHRHACVEHARVAQMIDTHNALNNIVKPLEQRKNTVDIFFTTVSANRTRMPVLRKHDAHQDSDLSSCPLDDELINALKANSSRAVKRTVYESSGQGDAFVKAMEYFDKECGGVEQVTEKFDYVIILRNDVSFHRPIDKINFDVNKINILNRCEPVKSFWVGGMSCVHDIFWMMPATFYGAFRSTIGWGGCFNPKRDPANGHGHSCQMPLRVALNKTGHADAFGWLEPDRRRVHKPSPIADIRIAFAPKN